MRRYCDCEKTEFEMMIIIFWEMTIIIVTAVETSNLTEFEILTDLHVSTPPNINKRLSVRMYGLLAL
jgi:hypothetical protein